MKNTTLFFVLFFSTALQTFCQRLDYLNLVSDDFKINESPTDGGYYLHIKQKEGVSSVLLVESTEDKQFVSATYAFKTDKYNDVNGGEKRMLNGEFLEGKYNKYYLIDSSPEKEDDGSYFKIFIPYKLSYGFPWTRHGTMDVKDGSYFSVRTFSKKYADYSGKFKDNPFILRIEEQTPQNTGDYSKSAQNELDCLSNKVVRSSPKEVVPKIKEIISAVAKEDGNIDVSFVLDTTGSMEKLFDNVRKDLIAQLNDYFGKDKLKVNFVFFKDYGEKYLYNIKPFTYNKNEVQKYLNAEYTVGGGDIPEAVTEAVFASLTKSQWSSPNKLIIVITDAPPHPVQRGAVSKEMVARKSQEKEIPIYTILLPV